MKPCLLIPIYNHASTIAAVVDSLEAFDLPCLIVDDGSNHATYLELADIETRYDWVSVRHRASNGGRGAALRTGYRWAASLGFSHAVQLDADGQHDSRDVPRLLEAAAKDPGALVLGRPIFDESAPALRLYGRMLSQVCVWVETLSREIEDPLCGFRCIPLSPTVHLLEEDPLGDRMDFDPELVVRLQWAGVPILNVPTRVRYLEDGISHFALVDDNWRIARAHARLLGGMLLRAPSLLQRQTHPGRTRR